jgi:hypothetical protein
MGWTQDLVHTKFILYHWATPQPTVLLLINPKAFDIPLLGGGA